MDKTLPNKLKDGKRTNKKIIILYRRKLPQLPKELIKEILDNISSMDLLLMKTVSKVFNKVIKDLITERLNTSFPKNNVFMMEYRGNGNPLIVSRGYKRVEYTMNKGTININLYG